MEVAAKCAVYCGICFLFMHCGSAISDCSNTLTHCGLMESFMVSLGG